jgi:rRNA maturation RNase YbeY
MPRISVKISNSNKGNKLSTKGLSRLVRGICGIFSNGKAADNAYEISITMVGDAQIRRYNKKYLGKNADTDCLSFDLSDSKEQRVLELIINTDRAAKEAKRRGHSAEAEVALYTTHCLLHNLGFDDSTKNGAKKMHQTEDMILQHYGYGRIYNKTDKM